MAIVKTITIEAETEVVSVKARADTQELIALDSKYRLHIINIRQF